MIKNNYLLTLRSGGEAAERRPERPNNLLLREHFLRPTSSTLAYKNYIVVVGNAVVAQRMAVNTIIVGSILNWGTEIISEKEIEIIKIIISAIFNFHFKLYRRSISVPNDEGPNLRLDFLIRIHMYNIFKRRYTTLYRIIRQISYTCTRFISKSKL